MLLVVSLGLVVLIVVYMCLVCILIVVVVSICVWCARVCLVGCLILSLWVMIITRLLGLYCLLLGGGFCDLGLGLFCWCLCLLVWVFCLGWVVSGWVLLF